jgi:Carboxypeptidase regulatory-like domain/TonB dependent receptor-like, beta-barrel
MRPFSLPVIGALSRWILSIPLILCVPAAFAQNPRGTLRGTVTDSTGARIPTADIVIRSRQSAAERGAVSDARGEFRIEDLPPGNYRVIVSAPGFAEANSEVTVVVSEVHDLAVVLQPERLTQRVNVAAQSSSITTEGIDLASAVHQGAISSQDLETLPLAHRSFANIAYLVPGTEPVEPSDPTKARITAVSFGGSSGLNVELSVDGGDNSDDYIGGFLQNYSPDAIQEFVVRTAQEDADTGRTTGGSVVIDTKRGTNEWHGDAAFYERASGLNARLPIDNPPPEPKQPFSRQNYIGTLGGPIRRDKIWFFSSLEYVHEDASIAYSPGSISEFQSLAQLATAGLIPGVNAISVPNNTPVPFDDYLATTRFDWAQSQRSQWFLRAAVDRYTTDNDLVQQATLPSTGATSRANYMNLLLNQHFTFSPTWLGSLTFEASGLHHTETRNVHLGFALAFPFSSTASAISGFETFGDNQFVTPITAFPVLRNQEKYQFRYDVSHTMGRHAPRFGINLIHEPVLSGALSGTAETLIQFPNNPSFYVSNPSQFYSDLTCATPRPVGVSCTATPASNGSFVQNVQRLGLYAEDSWRVTSRLTVNYGLRYETTFGLFNASGRTQLVNPVFQTLQALDISTTPFAQGAPHDYHKAFAPRLGLAYAIGQNSNTVFRAGFGLYYNDLAQNGWVEALQAVNTLPGPCIDPQNPPNPANSGCATSGSVIDSRYRTPYAIHSTAGFEHAFNEKWLVSADYTHEQGNHGYRRYDYSAGTAPLIAPDPALQPFVPDVSVFRSDNRSSYNALSIHLQGNVSRHFNLTANYTLAKAQTWGCVLGELFDYVNGVCDPSNPFGPGDYGPSGEDVRHRFVLAGLFRFSAGFEITTLTQAESARPFTITNLDGTDRVVVDGVKTPLDGLRGTPYIQVDMRLSRPIKIGERFTATPFIEFFNLFNRNNPGANYVTNVGALPVNDVNNVTALCSDPACAHPIPVTSPNQLRVPAGALGDFFGPGTTVGIPFAAQVGARFIF